MALGSEIVVDVRLRARRLCWPRCRFTAAARYDTRPVPSSWRHTDLGRWQVIVRAGLRRLCRPTHGVRVEAVDFARYRSGRGGDVWRAHSLKEAFRHIFDGDLNPDQAAELINRWRSKASRSRLPPFVKVAKTIRKYRDGILAAIRLGVNNARAEGPNNHVRLITRRAYGFHSPKAALALIMLSRGPIELHLPHERAPR